MKYVLFLVIVDTLDDFRSYKGTLCNNSLERYHTVQMDGTQRPRVAGTFAEASNEGAVVHLRDVRQSLAVETGDRVLDSQYPETLQPEVD